ncbi:MAG TPA: hypothetical protein VH000_01530, partial [Rhizomicrobium sp.]|nr:hypothetical protein [Rhizomicrobium sp.]
MSLQLVRGRDLKPPQRPAGVTSASPVAAIQDIAELPKIAAKTSRKAALRFPANPETRNFYRRFYPGTSAADWNDWR